MALDDDGMCVDGLHTMDQPAEQTADAWPIANRWTDRLDISRWPLASRVGVAVLVDLGLAAWMAPRVRAAHLAKAASLDDFTHLGMVAAHGAMTLVLLLIATVVPVVALAVLGRGPRGWAVWVLQFVAVAAFWSALVLVAGMDPTSCFRTCGPW